MADAVQVNLQQHPQAKIVNSGADKIIWKCSCWCSGKLYAKHLKGELNCINRLCEYSSITILLENKFG